MKVFLLQTKKTSEGSTEERAYSIDTPRSKSPRRRGGKKVCCCCCEVTGCPHKMLMLLQKFGKFSSCLSNSLSLMKKLHLFFNTLYHSWAKKVPSVGPCLSGKFDMDKNRGQQNGGVKTLVSVVPSIRAIAIWGSHSVTCLREWEVLTE